ncbi:TIGR01777 family oxidoreductase [Chloracidobacterium aggregatum]|uniref:TIGR01777 family oxidoreductase n=1 Tax=Chloracidobacterium sp. N TaxID=2821540 RepID=A0ABX8AYY2_9BACT|nr:TIGR01777 family oxidoreductase [Chloracidobacterium aggregatum]QUV83714.1 TIGR01777 family oxidoreductase [Chloracidobacterium sp. 2]QUV87804.1 TIGR01777 family oxidoreductase [Chloracidobacterium sp. S]QUV90703.1 TIGR01777 family oxidoreductase [Chloracidobacterium sp. A]QUV93919.1 TIGR01777 family oxidoreductase [Chloracidobacterium sp. N]QUV97109.1 TIGR01777 family oxidoreductase [Chloracidobacterium sp. E]
MRKLFITGASGFVGQALLPALKLEGYDVVAVSRKVRDTASGVRWVLGDPVTVDDWQKEVDGAFGLINLAGEPIIGKRWTPEQKKALRDSRVVTTQNLVTAIAQARQKPSVLVSASAIGLYPKNEETELDEASRPADDFLGKLCQEWEDAAKVAEVHGVRTVLLRIGVVLGRNGGALERMLPVFRWGLGGPLGSGNQWFSWVHLADVVGLILWALASGQVQGPVNAVAPNPVRMKDFASTLGKVLNRPAFLPAPSFALNLVLGESAQVVLDGQRVLPKAALQQGYTFRFPELEAALRDLTT